MMWQGRPAPSLKPLTGFDCLVYLMHNAGDLILGVMLHRALLAKAALAIAN
ncbi:MAG TPA: hypothetical protein VN626_02280 [Clostridia bacterium]|nr:hypothetical protein [Clostridia bacterium]